LETERSEAAEPESKFDIAAARSLQQRSFLIGWTKYTSEAETVARQQAQQSQQARNQARTEEAKRATGRRVVELLRQILAEFGSKIDKEPFASDTLYVEQLLERDQRALESQPEPIAYVDHNSAMVYVHRRLRKNVARALFLDNYAGIKVDLRDVVKTWEAYVKPSNGAKGLINKFVLVVEGFDAPTLFAVVELARLFAESPLVKRVNQSPLYAAARKFRMPIATAEHMLIHAKQSPKGAKHRDAKTSSTSFAR
jgi:hypothetical protein